MDIKAIISGWGRAMGLMNVSDSEQELSSKRLIVCGTCEHVKPNTCLEFINGGAIEVKGMYCNNCFCPCLQKSLSDKVCELGKWDNITTEPIKTQ